MPNDPRCNHLSDHSVRISTHANLHDAWERGLPFASVTVCDRPECQEDGKRWVRESVPGSEPVVVALPVVAR